MFQGTVRLTKLQEEIAALTGVEPQYQRLSTRVEPHIWIRGSSKRIVEALSGNLWLLLDVDSNKMDSDKMAIPVTLFKPASNPQANNDAQMVIIERRATFYQLKEKLAKLYHIPVQRQLLTEVQLDPVMQITYYKRLFTNDNAVLGFTNIKTIRLLELESSDLVSQENSIRKRRHFIDQVFLLEPSKIPPERVDRNAISSILGLGHDANDSVHENERSRVDYCAGEAR